MSKFTFELRELISTFGEDEVKSWFMDYKLSDFLSPDEIAVIEARGTWSKEQLAKRIIDHYYMREVGSDSVGRFKLFAKDTMNEIMESYAPLIYSLSIKYDPLNNMDYTETYTGSNDSNTNSSSKANGSGLTVGSDTPQGRISKSAILAGDYASSTSASENENTVNDTSSNVGNQRYSKNIKGNSGVKAQELIREYRQNIRALNTEIVYKLEPLFMGLY